MRASPRAVERLRDAESQVANRRLCKRYAQEEVLVILRRVHANISTVLGRGGGRISSPADGWRSKDLLGRERRERSAVFGPHDGEQDEDGELPESSGCGCGLICARAPFIRLGAAAAVGLDHNDTREHEELPTRADWMALRISSASNRAVRPGQVALSGGQQLGSRSSNEECERGPGGRKGEDLAAALNSASRVCLRSSAGWCVRGRVKRH